ncbi:MAG: hypothetical protein ACFFEF_12290 [Candidatus Thorarchaeota archaeon]
MSSPPSRASGIFVVSATCVIMIFILLSFPFILFGPFVLVPALVAILLLLFLRFGGIYDATGEPLHIEKAEEQRQTDELDIVIDGTDSHSYKPRCPHCGYNPVSSEVKWLESNTWLCPNCESIVEVNE